MSAVGSSRYSFTSQFLRGAAIFTRRADEIETGGGSITEQLASEHMASVVGAVTQSAAALEAEISEVAIHGPGHHLGSNGLDASARSFLNPLADLIDREPTLRRYDLVLHLLSKPAFDKGSSPYQEAALLIRLRNELIHYKSPWSEQIASSALFAQLERFRFSLPAFVRPSENFFPRRCLVAGIASWSVTTASAFVTAFYDKIGLASPIAAHLSSLTVPTPRRDP
jgi:hypothetical protein